MPLTSNFEKNMRIKFHINYFKLAIKDESLFITNSSRTFRIAIEKGELTANVVFHCDNIFIETFVVPQQRKEFLCTSKC